MDQTRTTLLDERQTADLLGWSPRTLQERRRSGTGPPFVRLSSRCLRYRLSDLEGWIEARIARSTADVTEAEREAMTT